MARHPAEVDVHAVAPTALHLPAGDAAAEQWTPEPVDVDRLVPAVTVWCDLDWAEALDLEPVALAEQPIEGSVVYAVAAERVRPTNIVKLTLSASEDDDGEDATVVLRVPLPMVAMAAALNGLPGIACPLLLTDDPVPQRPLEEVHSLDSEAIVVVLDAAVLLDALADALPAPWLAAIQMSDALAAGVEMEGDQWRDLAFRAVAGVALGSETALNLLADVAHAAEAPTPEGIMVGHALLAAVEHLEAGIDAEGVEVSAAVVSDLEQLPAAMWPLREKLAAQIDFDVLAALATDTAAEEVLDAYPVPDILLAAAVRAAVAAQRVHEDEGGGVSLIIADWLAPGEAPFDWVFHALVHEVSDHGVHVLSDVLATGEATPSSTLENAAHLLADTIQSQFDHPAADLKRELDAYEVPAPNQDDVATLALTLAAANLELAEGDCDVCDRLEQLLEGWGIDRAAAAAARLFAVLTDLDASAHGHALGDEDWVEHRNQYLHGLMAALTDGMDEL